MKITEVNGLGYVEWSKKFGLNKSNVQNHWYKGYCNLVKRKQKAGQHPLYKTWNGMRSRCYDKNRPRYKRYGGRGIRVCARWFYSFENFANDMGERPEGCTLDRINNDGIYSPDNCRWADDKTQHENRSMTRDNKGRFIDGT